MAPVHRFHPIILEGETAAERYAAHLNLVKALGNPVPEIIRVTVANSSTLCLLQARCQNRSKAIRATVAESSGAQC
jgi:hypothetical protein